MAPVKTTVLPGAAAAITAAVSTIVSVPCVMTIRASGEFRAHDVTKLAALGVEYELEASALLALQQAVEAYRKLRPDADWNSIPSRT